MLKSNTEWVFKQAERAIVIAVFAYAWQKTHNAFVFSVLWVLIIHASIDISIDFVKEGTEMQDLFPSSKIGNFAYYSVCAIAGLMISMIYIWSFNSITNLIGNM